MKATIEELRAELEKANEHFLLTGEYEWLAEVSYAIHHYQL